MLHYVVVVLFYLVANILKRKKQANWSLTLNVLVRHECILIELNFQEVNELNFNNNYWNMIQNNSLLDQTGKNKDNN